MREKIEKELEELRVLIEESSLYQEAKKQREKLLLDKEILKEVQTLQDCSNIYSEKYKEGKQRLFENVEYQNYQRLENELYFLSLEINQILTQLTKKGDGCSHEDH